MTRPGTALTEGYVNERPPWVLPGLAVLGVVALLVFFWLPNVVDPVTPPEVERPESSVAPVTSRASSDAPTPSTEIAPWSEAQLAKLRKEAQDVLTELLDVQLSLEELQADQWASDAFQAARELAVEGDQLYQQRQFEDATTRYRDSLAAMQSILQGVDAEKSRQLEIALTAIEDGDREKASQALDVVDLIEPANPQAQVLRGRTATLDDVIALLEQAEAREQKGDIEGATTDLEQASALDPAHNKVRQSLSRVSGKLVKLKFSESMSDGYVALDENRFDAARERFRQAGKLNPGSAEVSAALAEVATEEVAFKLREARTRGGDAESGERWSDAVDIYGEALAIDATLVFAKQGLERSEQRAELDQQLQEAINDPDRLADEQVAKDLEKILTDAETLADAGPRLREQITTLRDMLAAASVPTTVTLKSDNQTEVTVYRVARLGRFQQRQLELRPGKYTAVGTRIGYVDVRRNFVVSHERDAHVITIACTEPIQ